jgi:hypothetical protein
VSGYRLVFPTGSVAARDGRVPKVGYDVDGYRVDFVRERDGETLVFLGLHYGAVDVVKLVYLEVDGEPYPVTLAEAAKLADRARTLSGGNVGLPLTAVAVRLEQLVEEGLDNPAMAMLESEQLALRAVIARWGIDETLPMRVVALYDALARHAA